MHSGRFFFFEWSLFIFDIDTYGYTFTVVQPVTIEYSIDKLQSYYSSRCQKKVSYKLLLEWWSHSIAKWFFRRHKIHEKDLKNVEVGKEEQDILIESYKESLLELKILNLILEYKKEEK